jgi:hypothetical protein
VELAVFGTGNSTMPHSLSYRGFCKGETAEGKTVRKLSAWFLTLLAQGLKLQLKPKAVNLLSREPECPAIMKIWK